ncbi:hypothetical protein H2203_005947 [Taxawa tesnikishii (nom. ined.)]|nr:hypothetical protein H2203_005947 [Dothideales sp. JES 119]
MRSPTDAPSAASTRSSFGGTPVQTPVEIYHPDSPETPRRRPISYKGSAKKRQRSPLAAVREVNGKMNALPPVIEDESDTTQLAPPPEGGVAQEDRRPSQVAEQPAPLEIHLSTGAVVTVKPPELTAWQLSIYLQGPVRLPKPAVVPRNGSIASLEPFQEAVERVYQDALIIPRRKSDDAVVDDVCEWFEEFGFGYGSFGHEHFKIFEDEILTETETETVSKPLPAVASGGQFGSLPGSRPASLVLPDNAEVAQENQGPRRTSVPITVQDPTPEEENPPSPTTATPNIAHPPLPHSHISPSASPHTPSTSVLPLPENTTPPPRTPPLRSPSLASSFLSNRGSKSSFEWDVEETSARPPWLMTGRDSNKRRSVFKVPPPPKRASQNPVAKMRNLVRTASAIL